MGLGWENAVRKIYGAWHEGFGLCVEKDSGCLQVLSYRLGVFEDTEVSGTSTHSLVGFSLSLLPGPVPVKDALLGRLTEKPSFISNPPGKTGAITGVLSGSRPASSAQERLRCGMRLATAREHSASRSLVTLILLFLPPP